jgi:hypothetical protein
MIIKALAHCTSREAYRQLKEILGRQMEYFGSRWHSGYLIKNWRKEYENSSSQRREIGNRPFWSL